MIHSIYSFNEYADIEQLIMKERIIFIKLIKNEIIKFIIFNISIYI
jgi:hypothetical protein